MNLEQQKQFEESMEMNERETWVKLMPQLLAEKDVIDFLLKRKKIVEEQIKLGVSIIGPIDTECFSINEKESVKQTIKTDKKIENHFQSTLEELEKHAEDNNNNQLLSEIYAYKKDLEDNKKISYGKPQKLINGLNDLIQKSALDNGNSLVDNIIEKSVVKELVLNQKTHFTIKEESLKEVMENNTLENFVS